MEDNSDVVVAPENKPKAEANSQNNDNLFTLLLKFFKGILDVIVSLIKSFIAFFWALGASAKLTFIIILVIFCATAYYFGYSNGKEAERKNILENPSVYYDDIYDNVDTDQFLKELQRELNKSNSGGSKNSNNDNESLFNFFGNR